MNGRRLTPETADRIAGYLSQGGYDHVAAEAAGVSQRTFARWLRRGRKQGDGPYRHFYKRIRQARAGARLRAEIAVYQKDSKFWLRHGPGREQPDRKGWSTAVKPSPGNPPGGAFGDWHFQEMLAIVLEALTPFPEARQAVSDKVELSPFTKGEEQHDSEEQQPDLPDTRRGDGSLPSPPGGE
jgi:hypothetical protein